MSTIKIRYGQQWNAEVTDLEVEFWNIRKGQEWLKKQGRSLFQHYKAAHRLLWPEDVQHRWFDLAFKSFTEEEITVLMGCADSAKTYGMSCYALIDYWVFPKQTLWLVSSTEYRGCELRIWGEIKNLFNRAKERYDWLDGHPLESMHSITTDEIDDDQEFARSLKTGLILVPCKKGSQYVGLSAFQGTKALRLRHAGDEVAAMAEGFLNAYANWYGKRDFKGLMSGNPTDPEDQLCRAAEPLDGWDHFVDTGKTQTWRSKFFNAHVIAYDGRDSPNNDYPELKSPKFHFLVSAKKLDAVAQTFGKDSWQWFSMCIGKPNKSVLLYRVVTRQVCEENRALEEVVWRGTPLTSVYALDPNYGGKDRCVGGKIDFGQDVEGNMVISFYPPEVIPVRPVIRPMDPEPEAQIAGHVKTRLRELGISTDSCFYDAGGKGTLGYAFSKVFGETCPIPVDFGAKATNRPVRFDLFVENPDGTKRLKRCDEHYHKFVTELWFSVSELIRSKQARGLPQDVMKELCLRTYIPNAPGNRIEIEPKVSGKPTKPGFIERIGYSPDLGDWAAIAVEGARRKGFRIARIGADVQSDDPDRLAWFRDMQRKQREMRMKSSLNYAA